MTTRELREGRWGKPVSGFNVERDLRIAVCIARTGVLPLSAGQSYSRFATREGTGRARGQVGRRYKNVPLASVSDGLVLSYIISRAMYEGDNRGGFVPERVIIDVVKMARDLGLNEHWLQPLIQSLLRLTGTRLDIRNWHGRDYPGPFPLLDIKKVSEASDETRFDVGLCEWLHDELTHAPNPRVARVSVRGMKLEGLPARLYGWAIGFVGPEHRDGRLIRMREALGRLGANMPHEVAWKLLLDVVAADDLPEFTLTLTEDERGQPAIFVRRRRSARRVVNRGTRPGSPPDRMPEDDINLADLYADEAIEEPHMREEVSFGELAPLPAPNEAFERAWRNRSQRPPEPPRSEVTL